MDNSYLYSAVIMTEENPKDLREGYAIINTYGHEELDSMIIRLKKSMKGLKNIRSMFLSVKKDNKMFNITTKNARIDMSNYQEIEKYFINALKEMEIQK